MKKTILTSCLVVMVAPIWASSQGVGGGLIKFNIPAGAWSNKSQPSGDQDLTRYVLKAKTGSDTLTINLASKTPKEPGVTSYLKTALGMLDTTKPKNLKSLRKMVIAGIPVRIGVFEVFSLSDLQKQTQRSESLLAKRLFRRPSVRLLPS